MKRFGRWKSTTVAERYIDESLANKRSLSQTIQAAQGQIEEGIIQVTESIDVASANKVQRFSAASTISSTEFAPGSFFGSNATFSNCTFTINMSKS